MLCSLLSVPVRDTDPTQANIGMSERFRGVSVELQFVEYQTNQPLLEFVPLGVRERRDRSAITETGTTHAEEEPFYDGAIEPMWEESGAE